MDLFLVAVGFAIGGFTLGFFIGIWARSQGYEAGYDQGFRDARTIPIGYLKSLSIGTSEGTDMTGVIELADDVNLTEE